MFSEYLLLRIQKGETLDVFDMEADPSKGVSSQNVCVVLFVDVFECLGFIVLNL